MGAEKVSVPGYSIQEIDGFLTPEECDYVINISHNRLNESKVYSDKEDKYDTSSRKSQQAWLKDHEDPLIASISQRVAKKTGMPIENQEDLQVVSYGSGGFFKPHYDPCDGEKEFCQRMDGSAGPRVWTYLIYLNDGFEGGETAFPMISKTVKPKKGKCVVFQSTLPEQESKTILESLHGGNPVISGNKWICNKWVRAAPYTPAS
jgi:prolyl 4-hydroxylase